MTESLYHELDLPLGEGLTGAHVRQPRIVVERRTVDGSGSLDLAYRIEDDNPRYVALFLDQDKVSVEAVEDEERQFEYRLQLDPGVNQVRIVVHDDDGISRVELLRLWGPREAVPVDETGSLVEMP